MYATIKKWGNSAAIRIPTSIMSALNLQPESTVDIRLEQGLIVIEPVQVKKVKPKRKHSLENLLSKITEENQHGEVEFGQAVGEEVW